ncbi:acyltransferase [Chitinophaga sp. XS-30]|uniref:acyltransferase family protein n=1 Tax=Chitinophaga sp. XS-30 TaxID=2604421 RepID=UPI00143D4512|nr:acyltransferase [Chitinophaga sp. XS-30]
MNVQHELKNLFHIGPRVKDDRYAWIDYAKGIAIILVVYRHAAYGLISSEIVVKPWVIDLNNALYSFRMPLFFLLSGLFFNRSLLKRSPKNYAIAKVNTLLYPYLLWAVIQITLQILSGGGYANADRSSADYLNIFVQPRKLDQLWYLFALFNVSMLYLLTTVVLKTKGKWQLLIGLVLLGIAPFLKNISTFYDIALHYIFFSIGSVCADFFFSERSRGQLSSFSSLLLLLPLFVVSQYYFLRYPEMNLYLYAFVAIAGSIFTIVLSFILSKYQVMDFLQMLGHYSLYIYLIHVSVGAFIRYQLINIDWFREHTTVFLIVMIITTILLSILLYRVLTMIGMQFLFKGSFREVKHTSVINNQQA